ncbi:MAG: CpcT/CpeT family chromophore lyase [Pseudomonadota bacterium]
MSAGVSRAAPMGHAPANERDALVQLWPGIYDMTEELVAGAPQDSPMTPVTMRVQIDIRRVPLPWLGTHVLYVEEYPYDEPFELRRRVLLSIEPEPDGSLRVRQYTRKAEAENPAALTAADIETVAGCDIFLKREGAQFRGGTHGRQCLDSDAAAQRWLDYRVVIGDGLFWYRKRRLELPGDELAEEIAGFPHMDLDEARLFSCGISWVAPKDKGARQLIENVDLHDRGGRARFRTPDGRELQLELHGRDWPLSERRESLVLILVDGKSDSEPIASSWTSLDAARVGIDIGWLQIDCAPVVSETGEQKS